MLRIRNLEKKKTVEIFILER